MNNWFLIIDRLLFIKNFFEVQANILEEVFLSFIDFINNNIIEYENLGRVVFTKNLPKKNQIFDKYQIFRKMPKIYQKIKKISMDFFQ